MRRCRYADVATGKMQIRILPAHAPTVTHHHHHLWLAPRRVHSATGLQQPPERSVMGEVDCVGP